MTILNATYYGNPPGAWLAALGVAVAAAMGLHLLKRIATRRLATTAARTRTRLDDIALSLIRKTRSFFLVLVAVYVGSFALTLPARPAHMIYLALIVALLAQIAIWGNTLVDLWVARYGARLAQDGERVTTINALGYLARFVLWSFVLLLALDNLGVNVTALIAGLGITGIAVALAVQNILGDLFASLSIVLDKPFVLGDFITVDGYMGHVEYIGLKTTRIRSLFGEQIVFSNADLLRSRIRNYKRMVERRVVFTLSVTYETSYDTLRAIPQLLREIVDEQPHARFQGAYFKEYRDFALDFEVEYFVDGRDDRLYKNVRQSVNLAVFRRFHERGIEFAHHATARAQRMPREA